MSLRLYNTRTHAVETFTPADPEHVRMYVCGLTPSAEAHLGHARSFIFFDVLRRYLVHLGYRVTYVRNVTDIDDRSIATAQAEGIAFGEVVARHLTSFKRSMDRLGVLEPDREPHATQYVPEIVTMIAELVERAHAYVAADGVYYAVTSFARYGALSRRNIDELLVGARIAPGEDKRDPLDFALWKFAKPEEPAWPAPWGAGRPGWHIECSAMSHALLGEPLDIHGGGFDLVFPHHENEIAQSEPLYGEPLARWWVHGGLLLFDNKKMSKSLGNFEPLSALLERHDPQAIRLLFLRTGYRKPLNFTEASIEGATAGLRRLQTAYDHLRGARPAVDVNSSQRRELLPTWRERPAPSAPPVQSYRARFFEAFNDDINTAAACAVLFELANDAESLIDAAAASMAAAFMREALTLLGLSPNERTRRAATVSGTMSFSVAQDSVASLTRDINRGSPEDAPTSLAPEVAGRLSPDFLERLQARVGDLARFNGSATTVERAIAVVIEARDAARKAKDFALADRLRAALAENGVMLADSREGVTWSVGG